VKLRHPVQKMCASVFVFSCFRVSFFVCCFVLVTAVVAARWPLARWRRVSCEVRRLWPSYVVCVLVVDADDDQSITASMRRKSGGVRVRWSDMCSFINVLS